MADKLKELLAAMVRQEEVSLESIREVLPALLARLDAAEKVVEAASSLREAQRNYLEQPKGERIEAKGQLVGVAAENLDAALTTYDGATK